MPVEMRTVASSGMSLRSMAALPVPGRCRGALAAAPFTMGAAMVSSRVFHAPQPGHRPAQRELS